MTQKNKDCSNLFTVYTWSTLQFAWHNSYFIGAGAWMDIFINELFKFVTEVEHCVILFI